MKQLRNYVFFLLLYINVPIISYAQINGLTDTHTSSYSKIIDTPVNAVKWTGGFWGERFNTYSNVSLQSMWNTWNDPNVSHGFRNFQIAAGEAKGKHWGPPFDDGDMYKWLEAVAAVYAVNHDKSLDILMDHFINCVVKAQRADGYIHTPAIIAELNKGNDTHSVRQEAVIGTKTGTDKDKAFSNSLNFETYNLGHLMTAGIVHYRATGKRTLLDAAIKATDFLCNYYMRDSTGLAHNAVCPSHYMGIIEMYRFTKNPRYLALAQNLINIRGTIKNGTDDNQDRIPFREQYKAMGHAVRANYLYAGVADLYNETGEPQLMKNLSSIWKDITERKMYITGGCGALYDGTSPDATCYVPDSIQKVHQSYGRPYQLPNSTAHNETCANIGNLLFNWRMFEATGDAKYVDIVETCLYNSILSGISLDGERYFYTNPLRISADLPYTLRWPKERTKFISCFCCPPNTLRTLCEVQDYAYTASNNSLWVNLYGDNHLATSLPGAGKIQINQQNNYPWDGHVKLQIASLSGKKDFTINLRIPGWCQNADILINGKSAGIKVASGTYAKISRKWEKGDSITLNMDMPVTLVEANPLAEEIRGQVAVQRGPVVYCLESQDLNPSDKIDNIAIPINSHFTPKMIQIAGSTMVALDGEANNYDETSWAHTLYRPFTSKDKKVNIQLIPYYAWGNRGKGEMTVWMPVAK